MRCSGNFRTQCNAGASKEDHEEARAFLMTTTNSARAPSPICIRRRLLRPCLWTPFVRAAPPQLPGAPDPCVLERRSVGPGRGLSLNG
eukprot:6209653-Pleurochrysis_carterae.AAC.4